jgi:hydrogenase maturation factor
MVEKKVQLKTHQNIGGLDFQGPYRDIKMIPVDEGLFAVVCTDKGQYYLIDVGYAKNLRRAIQISQKKECWAEHKIGDINYAFFVNGSRTEEEHRLTLRDLKKIFRKSPCIN